MEASEFSFYFSTRRVLLPRHGIQKKAVTNTLTLPSEPKAITGLEENGHVTTFVQVLSGGKKKKKGTRREEKRVVCGPGRLIGDSFGRVAAFYAKYDRLLT